MQLAAKLTGFLQLRIHRVQCHCTANSEAVSTRASLDTTLDESAVGSGCYRTQTSGCSLV